jgi:prevent-host-death family protein
MPDVGVRELKTKASEIVRNVWKRRARYTITYRGRPVGVLLPLDSAITQDMGQEPTRTTDAWAEMSRLGEEIGKRWPHGKTSGEILAEMRR